MNAEEMKDDAVKKYTTGSWNGKTVTIQTSEAEIKQLQIELAALRAAGDAMAERLRQHTTYVADAEACMGAGSKMTTLISFIIAAVIVFALGVAMRRWIFGKENNEVKK